MNERGHAKSQRGGGWQQYQCSAAQDFRQRRTGIIYPDGRALNYEYGDEGSIDDVLNRVHSVHDDDLTVLAEFQYIQRPGGRGRCHLICNSLARMWAGMLPSSQVG